MFASIGRVFSFFDRWGIYSFGERFNPFAKLGALIITNIIIAIVTGVALLPFYSVSVHTAYNSVAYMVNEMRWSVGILHSLHRYSSDAAMLLTLIHLFRTFSNKMFHPPRELSWITGVIAMGILWVIGWSGYWLVWDQAGFKVAEMTARLLDVLPIFGAPLGRGLLLDKSINNQIFFIVFFLHMIIPLGLFVVLWIHVSRVNRPKFLVEARYWYILIALLVLLAILSPAQIDIAAEPLTLKKKILGDFFYVYPLKLFEKVSAGGTWLTILGSYGFLILIPWIIREKRVARAEVTESRCTGCQNCFIDCPYQAIEMRPRTDGKPFKTVAWVNPDRCVACGVCSGSCDSNGNNLPWLPTEEIWARIDAWAPLSSEGEARKWLLFTCDEIVAGRMKVDSKTGIAEDLPTYRVIRVPCSGHVNPSSVRRAFDRGFQGVFIATSLPGACAYREGNEWIEERIAKRRKPLGRLSDAERAKVKVKGYGRLAVDALVRDARGFSGQGVDS